MKEFFGGRLVLCSMYVGYKITALGTLMRQWMFLDQCITSIKTVVQVSVHCIWVLQTKWRSVKRDFFGAGKAGYSATIPQASCYNHVAHSPNINCKQKTIRSFYYSSVWLLGRHTYQITLVDKWRWKNSTCTIIWCLFIVAGASELWWRQDSSIFFCCMVNSSNPSVPVPFNHWYANHP